MLTGSLARRRRQSAPPSFAALAASAGVVAVAGQMHGDAPAGQVGRQLRQRGRADHCRPSGSRMATLSALDVVTGLAQAVDGMPRTCDPRSTSGDEARRGTRPPASQPDCCARAAKGPRDRRAAEKAR